jgi:FtsH-binding integral membrane protein
VRFSGRFPEQAAYNLQRPSRPARAEKEDVMALTAMTLGLILLTVAAGCLLWTLLFHFEDFYPAANDGASRPPRAKLLFLALTGLMTVGIVAVLFLEFQQLGAS